MANDVAEKLIIESQFENVISKSKSYIKTRNENELASLKEDTEDLKLKVNEAIENIEHGEESKNYLISLKLMLSIIQKFTCSLQLMENMKSKKTTV